MKQKFKKSLLALAVSSVMIGSALGQNIGFEDGNLTGWTAGGGTGTFNPQSGGMGSGAGVGVSVVQGTQSFNGGNAWAVGSPTLQNGSPNPYYQPATAPHTWTVTPYGNYMALVQPGTGNWNQMTSALGLSGTSSSAITTMLGEQATASGYGNGTPTTVSWISKQITLTAGQTFTMAWNFVATDYVPFNDGSITTLVNASDGTIVGTVNNKSAQYSLLGFINPGTGDYSVGSFGMSGWQTATYTVATSGTYIIGFASFNLTDSALSPILFVDENLGTVTKDGATFGAIAPNPGSGAPDNSSTSTGGSTGSGTGGGSNTGPTLVNNITGTTPITSDTLNTAPTFDGGVLKMVSTAVNLTQPFVLQSGGGTIDQNGLDSTLSGVISGTGALVVTNTTVGGSVTLTGTNTYTGSTTIDTNATLINSGSIASSSLVTNNGMFTNNGQAGNIVNNGGFTNNAGATVGTVTNNYIAVNSGTTGDVINLGAFGNNSTGVTGAVTNNNTFYNNGTTGAVTNNANATFTNNASGTTGNVTNSGTFVNAGLAGVINNLNVFTNNGTTSTVTNSGTFTNNNTTGDVTNTNAFTNAGTVGSVTNSGTFTNSGTIGSINNTGTFNITTSANPLNLSSYTQSTPGVTVMSSGQQIAVSGNASLGGNLTVLNVPQTYGNYTYLTAGSIGGKYDTLTLDPNIAPLGYGLVYTGTGVQLKVTPSPAFTLANVNSSATNLSSMNSLQMSGLGSTLGYDCTMYGENGLCASVGTRFLTDSAGRLQGGNIVLGKRVNDEWRVGMFVDQGFGATTVGNVKQKSTNPLVGMFAAWQEDKTGLGWGIQGSAATTSGAVTVGRSGSQYSEAASGSSSTTGQAFQLKTTYTTPVNNRTNLTSYLGARQTKWTNGGYTETGAQFPITYGSVNSSTTDVLAGATLSHDFDDKLSGFVTAGVLHNVKHKSGTLTGTSGIIGAENISTNLPGSGYTTPTVGLGVSYDVAKNQVISVSTGWQQKSLSNTNITTIGVNYTAGF